jgi:zinc transport system ATP-binding protein
MEQAMINIEQVSFGYEGTNVLEDACLRVDRGSYTGIMGCNGSGKSTLLRIILGQLKASKGKVEIFEQAIESFRQWHSIGYISQVGLNVKKSFPATAEEIVMMSLYQEIGLFRFPKALQKEKVYNALKLTHMEQYAKRQIGSLSGGQLQRVLLAKTLVNKPKLLILDEPTTGFDSESGELFYNLLLQLNTEQGLTIVMVSHDQEKVINFATDLYTVRDGKVFKQKGLS